MPVRSVAMAEMIERRRFSVDDYHRMAEAGILTEDDRVELIHGEILVMAPIGTRHTACVKGLNRLFAGLQATALLSVQDPVAMEDSEPEPDFAILALRDDLFATAHPTPSDVHLIVEVADAGRTLDREVKGPLYAASGIREYWLVDLETDRIEIHRRPEGRRWREIRTVGPGDRIAPEAFPDFEVAVDDVLP